jgi:hypothetical protein
LDDQLFGEIQAKLDKMRRLMITIDLSEEYKAHFIGDVRFFFYFGGTFN